MNSKELAKRLSDEMVQYPVIAQTLVKTVVDTVKSEIKEGRVLLTDLLESEDKFFQTLTDIVDLNTNTGFADAFDNPFIRKFLERILRPILVKSLGDDWREKLSKMLA